MIPNTGRRATHRRGEAVRLRDEGLPLLDMGTALGVGITCARSLLEAGREEQRVRERNPYFLACCASVAAS